MKISNIFSITLVSSMLIMINLHAAWVEKELATLEQQIEEDLLAENVLNFINSQKSSEQPTPLVANHPQCRNIQANPFFIINQTNWAWNVNVSYLSGDSHVFYIREKSHKERVDEESYTGFVGCIALNQSAIQKYGAAGINSITLSQEYKGWGRWSYSFYEKHPLMSEHLQEKIDFFIKAFQQLGKNTLRPNRQYGLILVINEEDMLDVSPMITDEDLPEANLFQLSKKLIEFWNSKQKELDKQ